MPDPNDEREWSFTTADSCLHTGSENPVDPEDVVLASGRDLTPARIEKARLALEKDGSAAVERLLP